ncbi:hypothetical protein [Planosporangium mesophilum]|uniref:Lipoprotein with Yx(FWY)xxD motif n=1 Tax=Planosporangium mesophilum TaxID=689768 RepID=A0A8J3X3M4_9ACTN|nr:hypothetical protein [Planosporangium mesophilum]NJC86138.1 hypothetical protein [Planosporangium mesophilum]GII23013.1 hypothetical protein Pme01_26100 [Planosporangium mesophilum]
MIRASRAAYLVCGVLTALALAGWAVRAAGTPSNQVARTTSVPLAAPAGTPAAGDPAAGGYGSGGGTGGAAEATPVGSKTTKLTAKSLPRMGQVVVDDGGWVLYRFDKDTANPPASNCKDKCAQVWPPLLSSDGNAPQLEGVNQDLVGTIKRADGGTQITLGGWPLYRYVGDKTPGKWTGQMVGGTWFVSTPTGKKNLTCLPTSTPTPAEPPAAGGAGTGGDSGGY